MAVREEMPCKQAEKRIPAFLRDDMDRRERRAFLYHVDHCPSCLEELSIQFLVTVGMQRLENGDTFDLNRELKCRLEMEKKHVRVLDSLQSGLFATEAISLLLGFLTLLVVAV